ncbi:type III secretion system chaperone [Algicola sagamiensis]|uniref:type III secretion system chaperone n=1 Tax=Algicola sagamiensis TaxID=163869 RepID=UPI00036C9266|nr:type III secretion system chaperone [Algicola sagamiensis]
MTDVLAEFGGLIQRILQMGSKPAHENGVIAISFDEKFTLCFEFNPKSNGVVLYATLSTWQGLEQYAEVLLKANAYGNGTQGAYFTVDEHTNELLLEKQFYAPFPSTEEMTIQIENFLNVLDIWQQRLKDLPQDPEAVPQQIASPMMKV